MSMLEHKILQVIKTRTDEGKVTSKNQLVKLLGIPEKPVKEAILDLKARNLIKGSPRSLKVVN